MTRDVNRHGFPMPRTAFVLLLITNFLSILPHIERVPSWLLLAFAGILVWRIQIFRQRLPFPSRSIRLLLVVTGFAGIILHHGTVLGPDAGVGLLITAYLFKQLEMATRRDAFLVVILSYFVLATEFLFSRSLYTTIYVLMVLLVITATQVALNQTDARIAVWRPLRVSATLILQSIPLMLALFFLFPRIGPLWQLNLHSQQNRIGLGDRLSPGDISNLSRSGELAFRVTFEGDYPPNRELYWRAAVFDRFDGRNWMAMDDDMQTPLDPQSIEPGSRHYDYQVYLEATGKRWLMAMPAAQVKGIPAIATQALTYLSKEDIDSTTRYQVTSYPDFTYQKRGLSLRDHIHFLQLPADGNLQSQLFAQKLYKDTQSDPARMIESLLEWFNQEEFYYTLRPPKLGADTVDEFLFESRRGYCSHYAGAFVFLLRSAGIPARLIAGYQGGERHPLGNYMLVHQYDAHAWAEAWLPGRGWVRFDPTAAVAPNRIELGVMDSTTDDSFLLDSPLSPSSLRNLAMLARARLLIDYVDYLWFKNVVSYNTQAQSELFKSLLGDATPQRIAALLAAVAGTILGILSITILLRHPSTRKLDRVDRLYLRFCQRLARGGLPRSPGDGPETYAERAAQTYPDKAAEIRKITSIYLALKYAPQHKGVNIQQQPSKRDGTLSALEKSLAYAVSHFKL